MRSCWKVYNFFHILRILEIEITYIRSFNTSTLRSDFLLAMRQKQIGKWLNDELPPFTLLVNEYSVDGQQSVTLSMGRRQPNQGFMREPANDQPSFGAKQRQDNHNLPPVCCMPKIKHIQRKKSSYCVSLSSAELTHTSTNCLFLVLYHKHTYTQTHQDLLAYLNWFHNRVLCVFYVALAIRSRFHWNDVFVVCATHQQQHDSFVISSNIDDTSQ